MVQRRNCPAVGPSVGLTPTTHTKVGLQRRSKSISECNESALFCFTEGHEQDLAEHKIPPWNQPLRWTRIVRRYLSVRGGAMNRKGAA